MASLSPQDVLRIWEAGAIQNALERALTILGAASPATPRDDLAALPVGRRDARLLQLRHETFGSTLHGFTLCPACGERIELALEIPQLLASVGEGAEEIEGEVRLESWSLRYRLPCSDDIASVAVCGDPGAARQALARRCIVDARRGGAPVDAAEVPSEAIDRMASAMAARDSVAEVLLDFACPACGCAGQTLLDIAGFLWDEIRAEAVRLLYEVDALARAYGWREADILSLSATRRRAYAEIAS